MGMDVYGKNPTTDEGKYFRANVWWWHPLADYILEQHPRLAAGCTYWHSNDGDGLNARASRDLAKALQRDLDNNTAALYAADRDHEIASLALQICTICSGLGYRTDDIGRQHGLDKPRDPITGEGGCNACGGAGKVQPFVSHYHFDVETLTEFVTFLQGCGGFEIC